MAPQEPLNENKANTMLKYTVDAPHLQVHLFMFQGVCAPRIWEKERNCGRKTR